MRLRAIFALVLPLAGLALFAPAAQGKAAPSSQLYPPTTCPTLSVSTTHPLPGETITVGGTNFDPHAGVTLRIKKPKIALKTVTTDAQGSFTTSVKLPDGLTGNRILTATGGQSACPVDPIQLSIQSGNGASQSNGNGGNSGGGGTAFTGVDVAGLLAIAAALIGAGILLNRRSRSGKRTITSS